MSETLPEAYNGCPCQCHRVPGILHLVACCGRLPYAIDQSDLGLLGSPYPQGPRTMHPDGRITAQLPFTKAQMVSRHANQLLLAAHEHISRTTQADGSSGSGRYYPDAQQFRHIAELWNKCNSDMGVFAMALIAASAGPDI